MQQMDFFDQDDRLIHEELAAMQRQIRGLFARFNYLEKEWIYVMREKSEKPAADGTVFPMHQAL